MREDKQLNCQQKSTLAHPSKIVCVIEGSFIQLIKCRARWRNGWSITVPIREPELESSSAVSNHGKAIPSLTLGKFSYSTVVALICFNE